MIKATEIKTGQTYWNDGRVEKYHVKPPSSYVTEMVKTYLPQLAVSAQVRALDAGCGGGRNSAVFLTAGFDAHAFDFHEDMVAATQAVFAHNGQDTAKVIQQEMSNLQYLDESFDVVLSNGVIHNAISSEHFEATARELSRIIKPGGHLILSVFTAEIISEELQKTNDTTVFITADGLNMVLFSKEKVITLFSQLGLEVQEESIISKITQVESGTRAIFKAVFKKPLLDSSRLA